MNWILLNIPLSVVIFLAIAGIPLWMVIRHPDSGPAGGEAAGQGSVTLETASLTELTSDLAMTSDSRELVGASAGGNG
jgi:hypothetical protein